MNTLRSIVRWFAGGADPYMDLIHSMSHDAPWIIVTVVLDVLVAAGLVVIALRWRWNERVLPPTPVRSALGDIRRIVLFCGLCGYLFLPVTLVWPAWRLYDLSLVALAVFTWRYAIGPRSIQVLSSELGQSEALRKDLHQTRVESERKGFFLNAISHDLRTPLNCIALHAHLAEMNLDSADTAQVRRSLDEIQRSVQAVVVLLDHLLELGRLDWGDDRPVFSTFELRELLDAVTRKYDSVARSKGLELRVEAPPDIWITTDRLKLERILVNLTDNAIKYTEAGWVRASVRADGRDVTIAVEDTGCGIAAEFLGRLFENFYQVHDRERQRAQGYGLGLAIVERLAEQIGGVLTVESTPGRGSRFQLTLPAARAIATGPGPPTSHAGTSSPPTEPTPGA